VIERSSEEELKEIARLRLAAVELDEKQYDEALKTLDAKTDDAFAAIYADLKGDVLAAAGKVPDARTAYQVALSKLDPKSGYRTYVQAKLDALGGPLPIVAAPPPAPAANEPAAGNPPPPSAPAAPGK